MNDQDRSALWIALSLALGPRSTRLKPLLAHFGTPEAIFAADAQALLEAVPTLGQGLLTALRYERQKREAERIRAYCARTGVQVLTPDMKEYPSALFAINDPPAVLYCLGKLPAFGARPFVGVVGTRKADAYGERMAYKLSFELAAAGAVIVSGLADGIDGIAAAAAIDAGAPTVAVLGCGIDRVYPKHHARLFSEVAEFGAIVTEFAPGTPPNGRNFPIRNRIISALSEAVLVVEADEGSGSLITARYALLQGKTLFAVPGDVGNARSAGCNLLLRAGAGIALSAEDILAHFRFLYRDTVPIAVPDEALQYGEVSAEKLRAHGVRVAADDRKAKKHTRAEAPRQAQKEVPEERHATAEAASADIGEAVLATLPAAERSIYERLPDTPFTIDHLVGTGVTAREAVAAMTLFEIMGIVTSRPGGTYQKNLA